jgi:hypothetical protein
MPAQETGKFRAARIPLDYYKKPDLLGRWNRRLLVLAILAAVGATALGFLRADRGSGLVSRGPVAAVHATWDDNCEACHVPFRPVSGEAWLGHALDPSHSSAEKCTTCHGGPPHHASVKPGDEADCASCHHEHRGRDASLVRVADGDCTRCHGDLAAHTDRDKSGSQSPYANVVTRFDAAHHPEFKLPAKDPGKLKFNHRLHLTKGLDCQFTLAKVDASARPWYTEHQDNKDPDAPVQLSCASCHRLDRQDLPKVDGRPGGPLQRLLVPPRNAGAAFLPISYDGQCAACHPLTIERKDPDNPRAGHVAVPHGLQPKDIHEFLQGYYTARLLEEGKSKLFEQQVNVRAFPGKLPAEETQQVREALDKKVSTAERVLYSKNTCLECHEAEGSDDKGLPKAIQPTNVPAVWFRHAVFDHTAHRAVSCEACHVSAGKSETSADVLLPGREVCAECHAPASRGVGVAQGGARFDCGECHRYHNGDDPLQGPGAAARGVSDKLDVRQFLSGGR